MMKKPNPEYIINIKEMINISPYFSLLSMKIVDFGIGYSHLEIDLGGKHLQPFGFVHGGVFASIIDATAFWAAYYDIEDQHDGLTTVDITTNYLAPVISGKLIATGRRIKMGKTLGYADAEVQNDTGKIVAHGTSTVMVQKGKGLGNSDDSSFPGKFIHNK
jgi:uncharacterized protein (TIGR00369 family)